MAGDWIKLEHTTPDKPEVVRMAASLKIDQDAVVGKLVRIWCWADQNSVDGHQVTITDAFIDRLANRKGFAAAMRSVDWLSGSDGAVSFKDFGRHNGSTAKARSETNRRVAKHRARKEEPEAASGIPAELRRQVEERDGKLCTYCRRPEGTYAPGQETAADAVMSIDHVVPRARGGDEHVDNLVVCCVACNRQKGDRTPAEAGMVWPVKRDGNRYGVTASLQKPLPEKRREEETPPKAPQGGPGGGLIGPQDGGGVPASNRQAYPGALGSSSEFRACWEQKWLPYLVEKKGRMPAFATLDKQLATCLRLGVPKAIAGIESAIEKGWAAPDENAKAVNGSHFPTVRPWETPPEDWKAIWREKYPPEDYPDAPRYEDGEWQDVRADHKKHIHELAKQFRTNRHRVD